MWVSRSFFIGETIAGRVTPNKQDSDGTWRAFCYLPGGRHFSRRSHASETEAKNAVEHAINKRMRLMFQSNLSEVTAASDRDSSLRTIALAISQINWTTTDEIDSERLFKDLARALASARPPAKAAALSTYLDEHAPAIEDDRNAGR